MRNEGTADSWAEEALAVAKAATASTLQVDKLKVTTLLWRAAREAPQRSGGRKDDDGGSSEAQVRIRDFVPVSREGGARFTREIRPDGSFVDFNE